MKLNEIFNPALTQYCETGVTNKKKALEKISKLINADNNKIKYQVILDALQQRERIGSTALGFGVAIPHARVKGIKEPYCVSLCLKEPVNFSAPDKSMVDLIFGLVVPENYDEQHLQLLAQLAEQLRNPDFRATLRQSTSSDEFYQQLAKHYD